MMRDVLKKKLHDYLGANYPEVLVPLQREAGVTGYLEERIATLDELPDQLLAEGKPLYIVEEICMDALTRDLGPSKFNYLCDVLQAEFEEAYYQWVETGTLPYEGLNLLMACSPVFAAFGFAEDTLEDVRLREAVIQQVRRHLEGTEK